MNKFQKIASKLAILDNLDISNGQDKSYYREARNEHMQMFKGKKWDNGSSWSFQDVINYKNMYKKMNL